MYSSLYYRPLLLLNRRLCVIFPTTSNFSNYSILLARKSDPRTVTKKEAKKVGKKKNEDKKEEEHKETIVDEQEFKIFGKSFHVKVVKTKEGIKQKFEMEEPLKSGDQKSPDDKNKPPFDEDEMKKMAQKLAAFASFAITMVAVMILIGTMNRRDQDSNHIKLSWSDFMNKVLPSGMVSKILVVKETEKAYVYMKPSGGSATIYLMEIPNVMIFESEVRAMETLHNVPPENWTSIEYKSIENTAHFIWLLIFAGIAFIIFRAVRKSGPSVSFKMFDPSEMVHGVFGSKLSVLEPGHKKLNIKFKDVAGLHEAKTEIREFVDYLKNPQKYTKLGAKLPKGALLTGPPGCGKTLLARALAAESTVPFISINGTEFVEMIGGLGASRMRKLFEMARSKSPCIVYIDEIDAIGRKRSNRDSLMDGGHSEFEQTLNQLLVEMDGVDSAKGIIMIASTNRPDVLDKALLRPGRFDRHISVDLPTILEREELFKLYLKKIKIHRLTDDLSKRLAQLTPKFSGMGLDLTIFIHLGADIANVVNEGAMIAANHKKRFVYREDLHAALEKVLAGPEKRSRVLQEEERHIVAYHEAGHCLVGWYLKHTDALLKVTIIPRTNAALGFAQYKPKDRKLFRKEELIDRMCMMLGGRAAEDVKFNQITSGAQNDLEKVTKLAYGMVTRYGMNDLIGPLSFGYPGQDEKEDAFRKKPYSKKLQAVMDQEARTMVAKTYSSTIELIKENMDKLDLLATELLKREVLDYEQVKELIGPPKYGEKDVVEIPEQELPNLDDDKVRI